MSSKKSYMYLGYSDHTGTPRIGHDNGAFVKPPPPTSTIQLSVLLEAKDINLAKVPTMQDSTNGWYCFNSIFVDRVNPLSYQS